MTTAAPDYEQPPPDASGWLDLDATAARVGAYVWFERRLFGLLGEWATSTSSDPLRVLLAQQSRERGQLVERWVEQLPAHVASDHEALVAAPSADLVRYVDQLAAATLTDGTVAVRALLDLIDRQVTDLRAHLDQANPVSDEPVMVVGEAAIGMLTRHRIGLTALSNGEPGSSQDVDTLGPVPRLIQPV